MNDELKDLVRLGYERVCWESTGLSHQKPRNS